MSRTLRVIVEIDNDPLIIRGDVHGKPLSPDTSVRGKEATKGKTVRLSQRLEVLSDELSALKANATDNVFLIPPDAKVLSESSDVKKGKRNLQSTGEKVVELLFWDPLIAWIMHLVYSVTLHGRKRFAIKSHSSCLRQHRFQSTNSVRNQTIFVYPSGRD